MTVQSELKAFGATQVLVYLKKPVADAAAASLAANPITEVTRHFARTAASRFGALAAAEGVSSGPAYRVYKNLGIVLGAVDEASYERAERVNRLWLIKRPSTTVAGGEPPHVREPAHVHH